MNKPFLSIAILTYKRSHRLKDLLNVLSEQVGLDAKDWEVVVSDNCSQDNTSEVVDSFRGRIPNLRYFQNLENIGGDQNMRSLFEKSAGDYIWLMPDDDLVNGRDAVAKLLGHLRACSIPPAFAITNAKSIQIDSGELLKSSFNPISGNIFLSDGKDILNVLTDYDLIGWQRVVVRRDTLPDSFADRYSSRPIAIVAIALAACTKGPALIIGEPLAIFRNGGTGSWVVYWPSINLQEMPEFLLEAVRDLGYSSELVLRIIERRKYEYFDRMMPGHFLLFQRFGVSWARLARLYGWDFVINQIVIKMPRAVLIAILWPWRNQLKELKRRAKGFVDDHLYLKG